MRSCPRSYSELDAQRSHVEIAMARAVAAWDARMVWANDGATSGTAWLAYRCELSRGSAATLVRTARRLRLMPLTEAAAGRGELGGAKVVLLANAAGRSETAAKAFERDEEMLVTHARELTVDQTAQFLRHWLLRADPDGGRGDANGDGDRLHVSDHLRWCDGPRRDVHERGRSGDQGGSRRRVRATVASRAWSQAVPHARLHNGGRLRSRRSIRRAVGAERGRPTLPVTISLDDLVSGVGAAAHRCDRRASSPCDRAPHGVRRGHHPRCVGRRRARSSTTAEPGARSAPRNDARAHAARPRMRVPGLRPTAGMVRGPPHRALARRRAPPTWRTWPCCATTTTRRCTKAVGRWPERPTAASASPAPMARPCSRRDSRAEGAALWGGDTMERHGSSTHA